LGVVKVERKCMIEGEGKREKKYARNGIKVKKKRERKS